jgi:diacylglycerol kinase family enzyme
VLQGSRGELEARLRNAFAGAGVAADLRFVTARALKDSIAQAPDDPGHLLVVAGGDGSVNAGLAALGARSGPTAILPLGTLNLLARDLGMTGVIEDDIRLILEGEPRDVDLADVNGHRFHSIAGFGFFAVMAVQREQARRRFPFSRAFSFAWAATRALILTRQISVEIEIDGRHEATMADAVLVTNNRFEGTPWRRGTLDAGELEVHLIALPTLFDRARAAVAVARGRWREMPQITTTAASEVILRRSSPRRRFVAMDGELRRLRSPLHFHCLPKAATLRAARRTDTATEQG